MSHQTSYWYCSFLCLFILGAIIAISFLVYLTHRTETQATTIHLDELHDKIEWQRTASQPQKLLLVAHEVALPRCGIGWSRQSQLKNDTQCSRILEWPSVVDSEMQDDAINPCENFYQYACGQFNSDPQNKNKDSTFEYLNDRSMKTMDTIIHAVLDSLNASQSKMTAFYQSCLTNPELEKSQTMESLLAIADRSFSSYEDMASIWGILQLFDTILPIQLSFELHPLNTNQLLATIQQSGLFEDPQFLASPDHLQAVESRLRLLYNTDKRQAEEHARLIVSMEQTISSYHVDYPKETLVEYIERGAFLNDFGDLFSMGLKDTTTFNFTLFLEKASPSSQFPLVLHKGDSVWCCSREYIRHFPELLRQFSLNSWRIYTKHAIIFHADTQNHYLSRKVVDSMHSLPWQQSRVQLMWRSKHMDEEMPRDRCFALTKIFLGTFANSYYMHNELTRTVQRDASVIVEAIRKTYMHLIYASEAPFFKEVSPDDRLRFWRKLSALKVYYGTPDTWPPNRAEMRISVKSLVENMLSVRYYYTRKSFLRYIGGKHVQKDDMFDEGQLISSANAFYQHQLNVVTLSAGLFQPPIFSVLYDPIAHYSRLGVLVAHEMTHSIDGLGTFFDASGSFSSWSSKEALAFYRENTDCLIERYTTMTTLGNRHNGLKTLNENIADTYGFKVAFAAFLTEEHPSVEDQQQFFLSYAQLYCDGSTQAQEREAINRKTHSVSSMRVNKVIMTHPVFQQLWKCGSINVLENKCSLF